MNLLRHARKMTSRCIKDLDKLEKFRIPEPEKKKIFCSIAEMFLYYSSLINKLDNRPNFRENNRIVSRLY